MLIPYKPKIMKIARAKPKYIIIHDVTCMYHGIDQVKQDMKKSQANKAREYNWILNGQPDVNYHFMAEKIGLDYESVVGRPLNRMCYYEDIPDQYDTKAVHICCMGKYTIVKPTQRFYQQVAYRVIAPMMFWFGIPIGNVYTHQEISTDKEMACFGLFFDKNVLISNLMAMKAQ